MTRNRCKIIEKMEDSLLLSKHSIQFSALFLLLSEFMLNFHFHPSKIRRYFNSKLYNGKKLQKKNCWYFKIISFLVSSWYVFNFYEFFTINVESLIFHFPKMEGKKSNKEIFHSSQKLRQVPSLNTQ